MTLRVFTFALIFIGSLSGNAFAIPIAGDYTLSSTVLNGTFTSDGNMLTAWSFLTTPATTPFTGLPPVPDAVNFNNDLSLIQQTNPGPFPLIIIEWNGANLAGIITSVQVLIGETAFRDSGATAATTAPIPEPSTMLLFGTGIAGLAAWRWKRGKHA